MPSGFTSGSPAPSVEFISRAQTASSLLGDAHEAADHARDHGLGDIGDEVARRRALQTVEHLHDDRPDRVLVSGDPPGRETRLEQRLQAIVLGWVHADEHRPHELDREHARGGDPVF